MICTPTKYQMNVTVGCQKKKKKTYCLYKIKNKDRPKYTCFSKYSRVPLHENKKKKTVLRL